MLNNQFPKASIGLVYTTISTSQLVVEICCNLKNKAETPGNSLRAFCLLIKFL